MNKKSFTCIPVAAGCLLSSVGCSVYSALGGAFSRGTAVAGAVLAAAAGLSLAAFVKSVSETGHFYGKLTDSFTEYTFIKIDKRHNDVRLDNRFSLITGLSTDKLSLTQDEFKVLYDKLTAYPSVLVEGVYSTGLTDKWYSIKSFSDGRLDGIILADVSDYIECRNIIRGLKAYDAATGIFGRDAFMTGIRSMSDSAENRRCKLVIIHFVLSGTDKIISFSGAAAADKVITGIAQCLKKFEEHGNTVIGRISTNTFSLSAVCDNDDDCVSLAEKTYAELMAFEDSMHESIRTNIDIYCGYAVFTELGGDTAEMVSAADFAAFDAESQNSSTPVRFNEESYANLSNDFEKIKVFNTIIGKNLITYHFQPIVNAHTGEIFGYEALMRPREVSGIKLSPLELLDIAAEQDMLYEVERLTFLNTLNLLSDNQDFFTRRKIFINCIPNSLLSDMDYTRLLESFGMLFDKVVVEITEGAKIPEAVVACLNERFRGHGAQLALDDYGTGYSNESTLLTVKPDFIKIDRSILMGINSDLQKQHLASNMIKFAAQHGIKSLAEGIETEEELETVILLGVDLIQGYITCKPSAVLMHDIPFETKNKILDINLKYVGSVRKTLDVNNGEKVDLVNAALMGYTDLIIHNGHMTLTGEADVSVKLRISCEASSISYLTLENCNISGSEAPCIIIENSARVSIDLRGKNTLNNEGIRVPASSELYMTGSGRLDIISSVNNPVIIGGNHLQDYGTIIFDMDDGRVGITAKGHSIVGIGGGMGSEKSFIRLINGSFDITLKGRILVGIGSFSNETSIYVGQIVYNLTAGGQKVIGIGSINGKIDVECAALITLDESGDDCCGIGTLKDGSGDIRCIGIKSEKKIIIHAKNAAAIGAVDGDVECLLTAGFVDILCEGDCVVGIGDNYGKGYVRIGDVSIRAICKATVDNTVFVKNGKVYISSGNIITSGIKSVEGYALDDTRLRRYKIEDNKPFLESIPYSIGTYAYSAVPIEDEPDMYVYLPEGYKNERCVPAEKQYSN